MNYEETLSTLKAIQASYAPVPFLANSETEPRFVIDPDTREIIIPEEFKFLAVKMDHMSEKIYFEIPRYFDDEDLATKICVVQYINTNGDVPIEAIVAAVDVDTESEDGKIIFRWDVDNYLTRYAGMVSFAVRFYTISDDNRFTYSWNTLPATLPVLDTLDNTNDTVSQNYPTELVQWQFRMSELDRTISSKIAEATESIDTNTKAAQAARQGAEEAEARVNAIVTGNEAYTKKQSHDLFALALRGTAEAAKSITIYPDNGSNVVTTAHGFTKQEGSGDASPANVRTIITGGRRLYKRVVTGTETFQDIADLGSVTRVSAIVPENERPPASYSEVYCNRLKRADQWTANYEHCYANVVLYMFISNDKLTSRDLSGLQKYFTKEYESGRPYILWYPLKTEGLPTKLYAPLIGTGEGHTGACAEITAPLCQGDKLITKVKSGCDVMVVYDGSSDEGWFISSTQEIGISRWRITPGDAEPTDSSNLVVGSVFSTDYNPVSPANTYNRIRGIAVDAAGNILIFDDTCTGSVEEWKAKLAAHPITVWYRSTKYTEAKDKAISLEVHVRNILSADGSENIEDVLNMGNATRGNIVIPPHLRAPSSYQESAKCSHFPQKNSWLTNAAGYYVNNIPYIFVPNELLESTDSSGIQKYIKQQYDAGKAIQFEYPLAKQLIYAHDPVDFIASPDEEGAWVITGEADGTVSAEYNKNITKALEDILTRVSALELHALGG